MLKLVRRSRTVLYGRHCAATMSLRVTAERHCVSCVPAFSRFVGELSKPGPSPILRNAKNGKNLLFFFFNALRNVKILSTHSVMLCSVGKSQSM